MQISADVGYMYMHDMTCNECRFGIREFNVPSRVYLDAILIIMHTTTAIALYHIFCKVKPIFSSFLFDWARYDSCRDMDNALYFCSVAQIIIKSCSLSGALCKVFNWTLYL